MTTTRSFHVGCCSFDPTHSTSSAKISGSNISWFSSPLKFCRDSNLQRLATFSSFRTRSRTIRQGKTSKSISELPTGRIKPDSPSILDRTTSSDCNMRTTIIITPLSRYTTLWRIVMSPAIPHPTNHIVTIGYNRWYLNGSAPAFSFGIRMTVARTTVIYASGPAGVIKC